MTWARIIPDQDDTKAPQRPVSLTVATRPLDAPRDRWPAFRLPDVDGLLSGADASADTNHVLATVIITNMVRATEQDEERRDRRRRDLVEAQHMTTHHELAPVDGVIDKTIGHGFLGRIVGLARSMHVVARS